MPLERAEDWEIYYTECTLSHSLTHTLSKYSAPTNAGSSWLALLSLAAVAD